MDEKWSTAYHEAGHCLQALAFEKRSFVSARILQVRGLWEGDSNIELRDISEIDRVNVSLAGIIAEGLAKTKQADPSLTLHEAHYDSFNEVAQCACFHFYRTTEAAWPLNIFGTNGKYVEVNLSRKDVEHISPGYRNSDIIIGTMAEVARFFNNPINWDRTARLAKLIYDTSPNAVGQFHMFLHH